MSEPARGPGPGRLRYAKRFEIYRLEALGDDPWFEVDEARARFAAGTGILTVVPDADPPPWSLTVSSGRDVPSGRSIRIRITSYAPSRAWLREDTWEAIDGELVRRRSVDSFYPDGDPARPGAGRERIRVAQLCSTDGVLEVSLSSPLGDGYWEVAGVPPDGDWLPIPEFGDWGAVVAASAPAELERFGLGAIDAAIAHAERCAARGEPIDDPRRWRVPAGVSVIVAAVDAVLGGDHERAGIPVLDRAPATIVPLAAQGGAPSPGGRDPREDRRRVGELESAVSDAFEQREGRPIAFDLERRGDDEVAALAASLRAAGATAASWWLFGAHGVLLVRSGDEHAGDLALAVHVVPAGWVSERHSRRS